MFASNLPFIDFMRYYRVLLLASLVLMLVALVMLVTVGIPLGLDFAGGVLTELRFTSPPDINQVREQLVSAGITDAVVQFFGTDTDVIIRFAESKESSDLAEQALVAIQQLYPDVERLRLEFVGAQIGSELIEQGGLGVLVALIAMLVYVAIRFQYKFAVGTVLALFHDVLVVLLIFSIFQIDFDLTVLAAVMTVVGYSINDSLVVSDHIREEVKNQQRDDLRRSINQALNQVLGRTINTSLTTLLVTLTLLFFGGESVHSFALALSLGVVVGTYSSLYILCSLLLEMKLVRKDLVVLEQDKESKIR